MNQMGLNGESEAQLRYLDADYEVIRAGSFVRCAQTGDTIALRDLRYWSVDRQEAYANAQAANKARDLAKARGEGF